MSLWRVGVSTWHGGGQLPAPEEDGPGRPVSGGCLLQEVAELGTFFKAGHERVKSKVCRLAL